MIISCITTASNKAVLIKGIPFRIIQIKGFVVNTETNQVLHICINRLYTENKIYINTAAVFGIKGLLLTQKGHAGVSNLNLGELKKVLKKLEDRK